MRLKRRGRGGKDPPNLPWGDLEAPIGKVQVEECFGEEGLRNLAVLGARWARYVSPWVHTSRGHFPPL